MRTATVIVPSAAATVAIPGTGRQVVVVPSTSVGVAVPGTGSTVVAVPSASAVVQVGAYVSAAVIPTLTHMRLTANPGMTRALVSASTWSGGNGAISYRAVRVSDNAVIFTSAPLPSTPGTGYAGVINLTGLTTGTQYRCEYYLDMTPDVSGYVEQWRTTGMVWTQPSALDPPVDVFVS